MKKADHKKGAEPRPPVVVVLGHVDHGKTTLLDAIRKTNVAAREAGGITQSIGAYEITHNGRLMTFIDTPGHEAFTNMRSRGAKVADIAILVVAIDDGVQPQTKEAIGIIKEAGIPFVVALNKIDKSGVDENKVKNQLTAEGVLLEGYGGSISAQPISAKVGTGIPELLDLVLLAADLGEFTCDLGKPGEGVIIEAKLESRRGIVATAIIKNGTVNQGTYVAAGGATGKIKGLENFLGKRITSAVPSAPVLILGFESLPKVGDKFTTSDAPITVGAVAKGTKAIVETPKDTAVTRLILKADVSGSLEALAQIVEHLPKTEGVMLLILSRDVGEITDGDVKLAISTGASIIGFRVGMTKAAQTLSEAHRVEILTSEIVYDLVKSIEEKLRGVSKGIVKGDLEILAIFGKKGSTGQVVGGKVVAGEILNQATISVERRGALVGSAKIVNLQTGKKDVQKIGAGNEGGLLLQGEAQVKVGDHLVIR